MVRKLLAGAAALSMMATPALAAPVATTSPAAKLSLKNAVPASARASTVGGKSKLAGGGGFVVAAIAAIAVITGIIIVANEDDSDSN